MKYGFIGCGSMGGAIAKALSTKTKDIQIADRSGKGKVLAQELGIVYGSNEAIARECDRIFLGVKPHMMAGMLAPLAPILAERKPLLITMAAGLTLSTIEAMAGTRLPVIRIMPNTPTALGKGVIPYCCNDLVDQAALSGSGPAYVYVLLEALSDGAVACGIPRAKAMEYAAMTLVGSAEMFLAGNKHPGALKDAVCSPGGSTIEGLRVLEQHGFRGAVMDCVIAAWRKNQELGKS